MVKVGRAFRIFRARDLKAFHCLQASMWRDGISVEDDDAEAAAGVAFALLELFLATDFFLGGILIVNLILVI